MKITSLEQTAEGAFHVMEPTAECRRINPMDLSTRRSQCWSGRRLYPTGALWLRQRLYDRYFARYAKLNRFALAYENQLNQSWKYLTLDIKMHRIYTETGEYDII